jgi:hypothetical protein
MMSSANLTGKAAVVTGTAQVHKSLVFTAELPRSRRAR